jgi:hypothetical protein
MMAWFSGVRVKNAIAFSISQCLALRFVAAGRLPFSELTHGSARTTAGFPQRAAATTVEIPFLNISPSEPL